MLPKAHSTLHLRMSGSRWVITRSWLSGSWRYFLYNSSVYSCHLFLTLQGSQNPPPYLRIIEFIAKYLDTGIPISLPYYLRYIWYILSYMKHHKVLVSLICEFPYVPALLSNCRSTFILYKSCHTICVQCWIFFSYPNSLRSNSDVASSMKSL